MAPWLLTAQDLRVLRTPSGADFTIFVDSIIRAHCASHNVAQENIQVNIRTNLGDGGVDTEVRQGIASDPFGWMPLPTCWQYKATDAKSITEKVLQTEIAKEYAQQKIRQGYAYRFCVCDDTTAEKIAEWERVMTEAVRAINAAAPAPRALAASSLATWASNYPKVILQQRPYLTGFTSLDAWKSSITESTRRYVRVENWASQWGLLERHLELQNPVDEAVLVVQGQPGVGKTRLVFEAVSESPGAQALVLYSDDQDQVVELSRQLANDRHSSAILVSDECQVEARYRLEEILKGHTDRIRVVAIDNSLERAADGVAELNLEAMPDESALQILAENFPAVPPERRQSYIDLSGGYIKLASDLCRHDARISAGGHWQHGLRSVRDYLRVRLSNELRQALNVVALVTRIGMRGDVEGQLRELCDLVGLNHPQVQRSLQRLKDTTGFVVRGPRYFYATPEVVAQAAFREAWSEWIEPDVDGFLRRLNGSILESFQDRVSRSGAPEVRERVGAFFRRWAEQLTLDDLLQDKVVERFQALIETTPAPFILKLEQIVLNASDERLKSDRGPEWNYSKFRRTAVWISERLAAFPEYFSSSERILYKLAKNESEPGLGNNATGVWRQLFRIVLSGTSLEFSYRLDLLRQRIENADLEEVPLCLSALAGIFSYHASKLVGPVAIAGRIVPKEWQPATGREYRKCYEEAVDLAAQLTVHSSPQIREGATRIVADNVRQWLQGDLLTRLREIFERSPLDDKFLPVVISAIENFLRYDVPKQRTPLGSSEYVSSVKEWLKDLVPQTFHGRLVSLVGKNSWHYLHSTDRDRWQEDIRELAKEFIHSPVLLSQEIRWLGLPEAKSSNILGMELAKLDREAAFLPNLLDAAVDMPVISFVQGYVEQMLRLDSTRAVVINNWLDKQESNNPEKVYFLSLSGGTFVDAHARVLRLVTSGRLSVGYLRVLGYTLEGVVDINLAIETLSFLVHASINDEDEAAEVGLEVANAWFERNSVTHAVDRLLNNSSFVEVVWSLLETAISNERIDGHYFSSLVQALFKKDSTRAIQTQVSALVSDNYSLHSEAQEFLVGAAKVHDAEIMRFLGKELLNPDRRVIVTFQKLTSLLEALKPETVEKWLSSVGVEGARALARHLPLPSLGDDGGNVIHPLTEYVLRKFESDEETFDEFCAGAHSFQVYSGDIARLHEQEATLARQFLNSPIKRVRDWANREESESLKRAEYMRQRNEEDGF